MTDADDPARHWRRATRLVRGGTHRTGHGETCEALFLTSGFVYDSAAQAERAFTGEEAHYVYSRYGNPTTAMLEERLALLEGAAHCCVTGSGMAAVFASLMCQLQAGDRVVASRALFGASHFILTDLLPRWGVETVLVDGDDVGQWRDALAEPAAAVLVETPSNPCLDIVDLARVAELARAAGARVIVDNVFATPILQKPLELGADIVVYSATKHIDGQGRCLGGAILTDDEAWFTDRLTPYFRNTGPHLSPFNAWLLLKGLETLNLRIERQCANAAAIAEFLERAPGIRRVRYPGLASHPDQALAMAQMRAGGPLVAFEVAGGKDGAFRFLDALRMIDISNNLGDSKSLAAHPATTTHNKVPADEKALLGITDGLIRLSAGLEDISDLTEDLQRGLEALA